MEAELSHFLYEYGVPYVRHYSAAARCSEDPNIESWKADIKFTDLRNINGYEYIKPR